MCKQSLKFYAASLIIEAEVWQDSCLNGEMIKQMKKGGNAILMLRNWLNHSMRNGDMSIKHLEIQKVQVSL